METVVSGNKPLQEGKLKKTDHPSTATHKALITRNLRLVYGEVAGEPIPDKIQQLLRDLNAKESGS